MKDSAKDRTKNSGLAQAQRVLLTASNGVFIDVCTVDLRRHDDRDRHNRSSQYTVHLFRGEISQQRQSSSLTCTGLRRDRMQAEVPLVSSTELSILGTTIAPYLTWCFLSLHLGWNIGIHWMYFGGP